MGILQDVGEDLSNINHVLSFYDTEFENIGHHLKIKGRLLDQALIEQPSWVGHYEVHKASLKTLRKYIESRIERARGKLWRQYSEKSNREMTFQDKGNYANHDPVVVELTRLFHEVSEREEQYAAACEALKQRGFMLNSLVKAKSGGFDTILL